VATGRELLADLPDLAVAPLTELLLQALRGRTIPLDAELPDTGVGIRRERVLAPPFIVSETYGTRASTVIAMDAYGQVSAMEQSFGPLGAASGLAEVIFQVEARSPRRGSRSDSPTNKSPAGRGRFAPR
jgi:uncharacterized protein with NRDE domain